MAAEITHQYIRAEIVFGPITVKTPDVVSFNVSRKRGQKSATFSASIKVPYTILNSGMIVANNIVIRAGVRENGVDLLNTVFTGYVYQMVVNPIRTDASKVMLNISGADVLSKLDGQNITRRVDTRRGAGRFGVVNNIVKEHSPQTRRFPTKVYTGDSLAAHNLMSSWFTETPDAFKTDRPLDRSSLDLIRNGLIVEKTGELSTEEEESP